MTKTPMNMRLSDEARTLMKRLGQKLGIDETSVVEMAVRKLAEAESVRSCEVYFQPCIDVGEEWQKKLQDFDISMSASGDSLVFFTKFDDHYAAIPQEYHSSILQRLGRAGRVYFCYHDSQKEDKARETKEVK